MKRIVIVVRNPKDFWDRKQKQKQKISNNRGPLFLLKWTLAVWVFIGEDIFGLLKLERFFFFSKCQLRSPQECWFSGSRLGAVKDPSSSNDTPHFVLSVPYSIPQQGSGSETWWKHRFPPFHTTIGAWAGLGIWRQH